MTNRDTLEEILEHYKEYVTGVYQGVTSYDEDTAMQALNLYIHEQMRLARIDELKLIQQCGKDHDLAGAVKWLVEDRIKELEGLVGK